MLFFFHYVSKTVFKVWNKGSDKTPNQVIKKIVQVSVYTVKFHGKQLLVSKAVPRILHTCGSHNRMI